MKLYIISLYLIVVGICRAVQPGSICNSDKRIVAKLITLTVYNNDIGQCECQITLQNTGSTIQEPQRNITVTQIHLFDICNYKLFYRWGGNNTKTNQNNHVNSTFTLELNGTLYVQMENLIHGGGALCLIISVTALSPAWNISLNCNKLVMTTEAPVISTSTTQLPKTIVVSQSQTPDTDTTGNITKTKSSKPTTMSATDQSTTSVTEEKVNNGSDGDKESLLPIIMGCIIGILVIILAIIITCILLKRRNHQKNRNSETPNHGATNMAVYSSLDDNLKDSSQYGQIVRQHQCDSEQTEPVPGRSNEYINVAKETLEGPNENTIEPNNNPNISKIERDYENM